MLILLNTGWVAHKYGKWRWVLYAAAGVMLFAIGWAIANLLMVPSTLSPGADTAPALWTFIGFSIATVLLLIYSAWLCYTDEMHGTYQEVAERYRTQGW
jgi:uncharacterized membrane protein YedE/YeeE